MTSEEKCLIAWEGLETEGARASCLPVDLNDALNPCNIRSAWCHCDQMHT